MLSTKIVFPGGLNQAFARGSQQKQRLGRETFVFPRGCRLKQRCWRVNIRLLHGYARLWLNGKKTAGENLDDLIRRLQKVHQFLCQKPNPRWKADREMIGFYLTSVRTDTAMTHPQGELK